jgi:hypothetical protein
MMFAAWESFILVGIAGVFGYHIWLGWKTGAVRLPLSMLAFEEFERHRNPSNFWGIMTVDLIGLISALAGAAYIALSALPAYNAKSIARLQSLNGCYESDGLPEFMRPPVHWVFRITNGVIFDRTGNAVSKIRLLKSTPSMTSIAFYPGIVISSDEHKMSKIYVGDTIAGKAYASGGREKIALTNDWGDIFHRASCR